MPLHYVRFPVGIPVSSQYSHLQTEKFQRPHAVEDIWCDDQQSSKDQAATDNYLSSLPAFLFSSLMVAEPGVPVFPAASPLPEPAPVVPVPGAVPKVLVLVVSVSSVDSVSAGTSPSEVTG